MSRVNFSLIFPGKEKEFFVNHSCRIAEIERRKYQISKGGSVGEGKGKEKEEGVVMMI